MKYLIDLFLLWKCLPDVLRHFKLMGPKTVMQDEFGNAWKDGMAGEPVYTVVPLEKSEVYAKMVGAAYAAYNLLNGGR